jgi:hypothetical protein
MPIPISLHDSAGGAPITNGFFTGSNITWSNRGNGNYDVYVNPNTWFGCDSPAHRVAYTHSGNLEPKEVALVKDVWP